MSKKVMRICDTCNKECKDHYWGGGAGIFGNFDALNYIGWRLKLRQDQPTKLFSYGSGKWIKFEICNECAKEMFKWLIAKKMGVTNE